MKATVLRNFAKYFKTIGHAKRLEIITLLQGHSLTVNQIVQMTGLRQATVSQHLMILKENGLASATKTGKEIYYTLSSRPYIELLTFTNNLTRSTPVEDAQPTVIDPICHMHLTPNTSNYTKEYDGVRHYFCGKGCLKEFTNQHKGAI
ncbi:MAG: rhodanese protein [uncultured bacterium]|nr:MAG: rhodanese protein [uncultured bacterium]KKU25818.1 MAG: Transcriptional regulator, ArsR family [Microgenomates group bacterium GW2011_GWA2_46_16]